MNDVFAELPSVMPHFIQYVTYVMLVTPGRDGKSIYLQTCIWKYRSFFTVCLVYYQSEQRHNHGKATGRMSPQGNQEPDRGVNNVFLFCFVCHLTSVLDSLA